METFGELISQARRRCGLRLEDLAKKIYKPDGKHISVPYLSDLEHNRRIPSDPLVPQIALALQLSEDVLYFTLGKLPPDIRQSNASSEQVVLALKAFRSAILAVPISTQN